MGRLKPIIITFDTGWNFFQYMINKIVHLMLFLLTKFGNIMRNIITRTYVLANTVCTTAQNLLLEWNSTPCHRLAKKHYKKRYGAGKYSCNLRASKKLCLNKRNCKLGRHNIMRRKVSILWPISVYRKAHKMICKEKKKMKPPPVVCQPLHIPEEIDLCNDFISKKPDYIDCFCIDLPQPCVSRHVLLISNLLDYMDSGKEVVQPSRKLRSVGPSKSKPKKTTSKKKINQKNKKSRSVTIQIPRLRSLGV